jgi:serine/threonine protein kinase
MYSVLIQRKRKRAVAKRVIKYTDLFGLAIEVAGVKPQPYGIAGTHIYMSPECRAGRPYNQTTDVWSLAVVFVEVRSELDSG